MLRCHLDTALNAQFSELSTYVGTVCKRVELTVIRENNNSKCESSFEVEKRRETSWFLIKETIKKKT